ncbi:MAG: hypothetical protein ACK5JH_06785 [Anaerocolumna sp.]
MMKKVTISIECIADAMEATMDNCEQFLSLMERTNFKKILKNDLVSYASKLNELRPKVAQQVLAQFPELVKLIQSPINPQK